MKRDSGSRHGNLRPSVFFEPQKQILYHFETRVEQQTYGLKACVLFRVSGPKHALVLHERTVDAIEGQAKKIDDALKKGKDDVASAAEPGKGKYVG